MQNAIAPTSTGLLITLVLVGMSVMAQFQAPSPGALLEPVGVSAHSVELLQGEDTIHWTSQNLVVSYRIQGWPSSDGTHELGGAVSVVMVNSRNGVIGFSDRPMQLEFDLQN